jgi:hypothetical protein
VDIQRLVGTLYPWDGEKVEVSLQKRMEYPNTSNIKTLPLIIYWVIWKAKNHSIFEGIESPHHLA